MDSFVVPAEIIISPSLAAVSLICFIRAEYTFWESIGPGVQCAASTCLDDFAGSDLPPGNVPEIRLVVCLSSESVLSSMTERRFLSAAFFDVIVFAAVESAQLVTRDEVEILSELRLECRVDLWVSSLSSGLK